MTEKVKRHLDELLKLSREEQAVVIDELLASVDARDAADDEDLLAARDDDEDPAEVRAAWSEEIQRRVDARGPYVPAEEMHASIDAELAAILRRRRASRG